MKAARRLDTLDAETPKPKFTLVKSPAPYSVGFNGHAQVCDCTSCAKDRVMQLMSAAMHKGTTIDGTRTVAVRAHSRSCAGHLKDLPNTKRLLAKMARGA